MEIMLQTVIIVFMLFLCSLCLFAVLVIARDMIAESMAKRKGDFTAEAPQPAKEQIIKEVTVIKEVPVKTETVIMEAPAPVPEPVVEEMPEQIPEPVSEPVPEEVTEEESVVLPDDPNAVKFSTNQLTMEEKYAMLSTEHKGYFDAIVKHAMSKEGAKVNMSKNYYDYKVGLTRLVRMSIKRGEIICEFIFIDRDFKNYASQADLKIRSTGSMIKITEPAAVGVAKDGIDLVFTQLEEEREYKKQQAREKRRAKRQAENADNSETKETVNV